MTDNFVSPNCAGIHNHSGFLNVVPIVGSERNIIYEELTDGTLSETNDIVVQPGDVLAIGLRRHSLC